MSSLILGTAQLGMPYGVVNRTGQPAKELALAMVRHAVANGVHAIDTARDYGTAEALLGQILSGEWQSDSQTKISVISSPLRHAKSSSRAPSMRKRACLARCRESRSFTASFTRGFCNALIADAAQQ